jgi:hypothetical protein
MLVGVYKKPPNDVLLIVWVQYVDLSYLSFEENIDYRRSSGKLKYTHKFNPLHIVDSFLQSPDRVLAAYLTSKNPLVFIDSANKPESPHQTAAIIFESARFELLQRRLAILNEYGVIAIKSFVELGKSWNSLLEKQGQELETTCKRTVDSLTYLGISYEKSGLKSQYEAGEYSKIIKHYLTLKPKLLRKLVASGEKQEEDYYDDDEKLFGTVLLNEKALLDSGYSESSKKSFGSSVVEPAAGSSVENQLKQNNSQRSKSVPLPQPPNYLTELLGPNHSVTPIVQKFLNLVPVAVRARVDLEMGKRYEEIVHGDLWMLGETNSVESTIKALGEALMKELSLSIQDAQPVSQSVMAAPKKVSLSAIGSFESLLGNLQLNNSADQDEIDDAIDDIHYETGINEEKFKQAIVAIFEQNPGLLNQYHGKSAELVDYLSDTARELTSGMKSNIN